METNPLRKLALTTLSLWIGIHCPAICATTHADDAEPTQVQAQIEVEDEANHVLEILQSHLTEDENTCVHKKKTAWKRALLETLFFTGIQHSYRLATEEKTRSELSGPFFSDWFKADSALEKHYWDDGGKIFTNWVFHPMEGSLYANLFRQNNPAAQDLEFGFNKAYLLSLPKSIFFSFFSSLQFETGPLSEASIGNVGMKVPRAMGIIDIVVTPTVGILWMVAEDALDRYLDRWFEKKVKNRAAIDAVRIFSNPTRSMANLMALKRPWYRKRDDLNDPFYFQKQFRKTLKKCVKNEYRWMKLLSRWGSK